MDAEFPLHSPDFYAGDPFLACKALRAASPVCWNDDAGFWALRKCPDIRFVASLPDRFSSARGMTIPGLAQPNPVLEGNLIFTGPPRHRQLRTLINSGFTPRQVAAGMPQRGWGR